MVRTDIISLLQLFLLPNVWPVVFGASRYTSTILPALHLTNVPTVVSLCTHDAFVCVDHVVDHLTCGDFPSIKLGLFDGVHGSFLVRDDIQNTLMSNIHEMLEQDSKTRAKN